MIVGLIGIARGVSEFSALRQESTIRELLTEFLLATLRSDFGSGCLAVERFLTDPRLCVGAGRHISSATDENIPTS
jgi:hypothetical protein